MNNIERAADVLRSGGLVAFPTETVYGLGADATNAAAVAKIFAAKGRPSTNPLICHVADEVMARRYAAKWPEAASRLAARFWPGPLTIVVPKAASIVPSVTAGLDSVGLRAPDHPLTLELIRLFDGPIAGPSANRSNHVSPTTAAHVRDEFGDAIDLILDGGPCDVGIESTVLDLGTPTPVLLRPGGISREQIESVVGEIGARGVVADASVAARSPGQQAVHYAPRAPAFRVDPSQIERLPRDAVLIRSGDDASAYARRLYADLRKADAKSPPAIYIELPPDEPQWIAVRDRIIRATQPWKSPVIGREKI